MTPAQGQMVQASFAGLAPAADAVAEIFYHEFFALDLGLRKLFNGDLSRQGRRLMTMIGTAVASLDDLNSIVPTLRELGCRHACYGVKAADYSTAACALVAALEQGLGIGSTPAVREAWVARYWALAGEMKAGARTGARLDNGSSSA